MVDRQIPRSTLLTLRNILIGTLSTENLGPHEFTLRQQLVRRRLYRTSYHSNNTGGIYFSFFFYFARPFQFVLFV